MSTYKELIGKPVKYLNTDPTDAGAEGQIWYNSTSGTFKTVVASGVWVSSADLIEATNQSGGAGITSASLLFGGSSPSASAENATYEYNGSGWGTGGNLNTSRTGVSGAGTQTAALGGGGYLFPGGSNHAETYDGSTWTSITTMPISQTYSSTGTQTVALYVANPGAVLEYNAPSWASGGSLGTPRAEGSTAGTQTAGLFFGGGPQTAASNGTEEYDGSAWTAGNTMNTARGIQIGGSGIQTSALAYGGAGPAEPNTSAATESYDGTSWSTEGSLGTATRMMQKGGSTSSNSLSGISAGGLAPSRSSKTEEYNFGIYSPIAATWASGGALPSARQSPAGFGSQTAAVACTGEIPGTPGINTTDNYDGTSWTNSGNYPFAASNMGSLGTQTAGMGLGGYTTPVPGTRPSATNEYDGSTWTAGGTYPIGFSDGRGCGTQTAGLGVGGDTYPPAPTRASNVTAEYDGSTWTVGGSLGTGRYGGFAGGIQTNAVFSGGPPGTSLTEEYNGSAWTAGGAPLNAISFGGHTNGSPSSDFATFGTSASVNQNQIYNGTTYSSIASLATNRYGTGGAGSSGTAGIVFGGREPGFSSKTEEYTAEIPQLNFKTLTSS